MAKKEYRLLKRTSRTTGQEVLYCYHAVTGKRLPLPGSPGFEEALKRARVPEVKPDERKTVDGAITEFCCDPRHTRERSASTRATYERSFGLLRSHYGTRLLGGIARKDIEEVIKTIDHSPAFVNQFVSNVTSLFDFAERTGIVTLHEKPNLRKMKLKTGKYATWEPQSIERFLGDNQMPQYVRIAFLIGFYTGQRISDVLAMTWEQVQGNVIAVTQIKTTKRVWVLCHPNLRAILDAERARNPKGRWIVDVNHDTVDGGYSTFTNQFHKAKVRQGLVGKAYPFHGLRKTAACMLYEAGCTIAQIKAVTGHSSLAMVEHYIEEAEMRRLAEEAIKKIQSQSENRFSGVHKLIESAAKNSALSPVRA